MKQMNIDVIMCKNKIIKYMQNRKCNFLFNGLNCAPVIKYYNNKLNVIYRPNIFIEYGGHKLFWNKIRVLIKNKWNCQYIIATYFYRDNYSSTISCPFSYIFLLSYKTTKRYAKFFLFVIWAFIVYTENVCIISITTKLWKCFIFYATIYIIHLSCRYLILKYVSLLFKLRFLALSNLICFDRYGFLDIESLIQSNVIVTSSQTGIAIIDECTGSYG